MVHHNQRVSRPGVFQSSTVQFQRVCALHIQTFMLLAVRIGAAVVFCCSRFDVLCMQIYSPAHHCSNVWSAAWQVADKLH